MDRLFRIPPVKAKARDGSNDVFTIEHRIGRDVGYFTRSHLMDKLGLEAEYRDYCKELNKKIHNTQHQKDMEADRYRALKSKANRAVQDYRRYLENFYSKMSARPLIPMFAFVPVNEKEDGLYIQGLLSGGEDSYKLVIGDPSDDVLWCEVTFAQTKKFADLNKRAELTAKALISHPGLNKDLRYRIAAIAQGKMPEKLTFSEEGK